MLGHANISACLSAIVPNSESYGSQFEDIVGSYNG